MFYNKTEDKYVHEGYQFTIDGVTYPSSWLNQSTNQEKLDIGLVEVVKTNSPANTEFYFVNEVLDKDKLTYINTPKDLGSIRELLWNKIKVHRDSLLESGVKIGDYWFHNDVKSRTQWERMISRSSGTQDSTPYLISNVQVEWQVLGGFSVPLTTGKIKEVVNGMELNEAIIFNIARTKKSELESLSIEELEAYDIYDKFPKECPYK